MRRIYPGAIASLAILLVSLVGFAQDKKDPRVRPPVPLPAQTGVIDANAGKELEAAVRAKAATVGPAQTALPLAEVVLYSSGVGYFQRDGQVDGKAQVDLRFKVDNINDLLKSMVVQDFDGGRIAAVTYGSRDPVTKTLKSLAST